MARQIVWERFIFLSGVALTATSYVALLYLDLGSRRGSVFDDTSSSGSMYRFLLAFGTVAIIVGGVGWLFAAFPVRIPRPQISLASVVLLVGATPIWLFLIVSIPASPGYGGSPARFMIAPAVLAGVTGAVHLLFRHWRDGWAISALVAAIICLGTLSVTGWIAASL